jgi:hypothetical protein
MSASGIAFTFSNISRKPLIAKEILLSSAIHVFFTANGANRRRTAVFVPIKVLNSLIV